MLTSVCFAVFEMFGTSAFAQSAGGLVTSSQTLSGLINGNQVSGYYVTSGATLTIQNATVENFVTSGGAGSGFGNGQGGGGGGLGAGGAFFVDTGATLVINNSKLVNNTAIGGTGGLSAIQNGIAGAGGTLNNGVAKNLFSATSNGSNGGGGFLSQDNNFLFNTGSGDGYNGGPGSPAGSAAKGFGGTGGNGAYGTSGWSQNPQQIANVANATIAVTKDALGIAADTLGDVYSALDEVYGVSGEGASAANPLTENEDVPFAVEIAAAAIQIAQSVLNTVKDAIGNAADVANLAYAIASLDAWNKACANGTDCYGGAGGNGGSGGAGSVGFGGGAGGNGGIGGAAGNTGSFEGNGGSGGAGGAGGFGGGGGAGGFGMAGTGDKMSGNSGSGGAGGAAGFGAGVGSAGGVSNVVQAAGCGGLGTTPGAVPVCITGAGTGGSNPSGAGGGDGFGGAIFANAGSTVILTGNIVFGANSAQGGASKDGGAAGVGVGTDLFMMTGSNVIIAPGRGNTITFNGTIADDSVSSISGPSQAVGQGAGLTIGEGLTQFFGTNTYAGVTNILGGAAGSALQAQEGIGLPSLSFLQFSGTSQYSGGVLEESGTFSRWVGPLVPQTDGNVYGANGVAWTGSGGFAAVGGNLTVSLDSGGDLAWGQNGFVGFNSSLIFGSVNSDHQVTFTNNIDLSGGTASIIVVNNCDGSVVGATCSAAGSTALMTGVLSGTGGLSVGGGGFDGTLLLSAINTYQGLTTINAGATLALTGSGSIANTSGVLANGVFDISGTTAAVSIPTLNGSGGVALGSKTLTVSAGGDFTGIIADGGLSGGKGGGLEVAGGTLTLEGTNAYTGTTTIDTSATLALKGLGSIVNSSVVANGTLDISQTSYVALIQNLSGGSTGVVNLGGEVLFIANANKTTSFAGAIQDGGLGGGSGGILVVAAGTETLSGTNTYTGATLTEQGSTLALSGNGSIAKSAVMEDFGTFDISQTTGAKIVSLLGSGQVNLGSQKLSITGGSTAFAGVIADGGITAGTGGSLFIGCSTGTCTQTLSGVNTYTGATMIGSQSGTSILALAGNGSVSASSAINIGNNGVFDVSQAAGSVLVTTLADLPNVPATGTGKVALGAQTLVVTAGSTTFSGAITDGGIGGGAGGQLAIGGGTQTLAGTSTYTGDTVIYNSGALALTGNGSIAKSSSVTDYGGTFDISQTTSGAAITTLAGVGTVALGAQNLTLSNASSTFAGMITDGGITNGTGGKLTIAAGTETLSGYNTYTGATTINPGATLAVTSMFSVANSSAIVANGTFDISQSPSGAAITSLSGSGTTSLGAQTLIVTNGSTTFSGAIADGGIAGGTGGNLAVIGGTQTLSGANTYTGATVIQPLVGSATLALSGSGTIATSSGVSVAAGGTFDISQLTGSSPQIPANTSIVTLTGAGNVNLGGNILTITKAANTFSGVIADGGINSKTGGALAVTGGTLSLTGNNTYSGGTTVTGTATQQTTLQINSDAALGKSTGSLALNDATLVALANITSSRAITLGGAPAQNATAGMDVFNTNKNTVILNGDISGSGMLIAGGGGTLTLCGDNTYSGGTVVGSGTTLTTCASSNNNNDPTQALPNPSKVVVLSPTGTATNIFTGTAHVTGALDIDNSGAQAILYIAPGDTLVGNGGVNVPVVVESGGKNAPGDGAATITGVTMTNNSGSSTTLAIDGPINSYNNCDSGANPNGCAGQYSSIVLTGTYTAGGTLTPQLNNIGAPANNNYIPTVGTGFVIVQAPTVLGQFSSIVQPGVGVAGQANGGGLPAGARMDVLYNPNNISLFVTPSDYTNLAMLGVNLTTNQAQVGSALNALRGPAGPRNSATATADFDLLFAQSTAALPHAMDTLTGEVAADAARPAMQMMQQFLSLLNDPTVVGRGATAGTAAIGFANEEGQPQADNSLELAMAYNAARPRPALKADTFDGRWIAWAAALGGASNSDGIAGTSHDLTASSYGYVAGLDYRLSSSLTAGFALGGGGSHWNVASGLGSGRSDALQAGAYAKMSIDQFYVAASLAVANQWMTTNRTTFAGDAISGKFSGQDFGGRVEFGYRTPTGLGVLTPYAAVQVQTFRSPTYSETDVSIGGTNFGLNYASSSLTDVSIELGARIGSKVMLENGMQVVWQAKGAWQHDFVDPSSVSAMFQAALLPGAPAGSAVPFIVTGAALPHDSAVISGGLDVHVTSQITIGAKFDGMFATTSQTYAGTGTVRYAW